jgi:hypothetical protein
MMLLGSCGVGWISGITGAGSTGLGAGVSGIDSVEPISTVTASLRLEVLYGIRRKM